MSKTTKEKTEIKEIVKDLDKMIGEWDDILGRTGNKPTKPEKSKFELHIKLYKAKFERLNTVRPSEVEEPVSLCCFSTNN